MAKGSVSKSGGRFSKEFTHDAKIKLVDGHWRHGGGSNETTANHNLHILWVYCLDHSQALTVFDFLLQTASDYQCDLALVLGFGHHFV